MQELTQTAPIVIEAAAPDLATQAATYAASDMAVMAATQAAAQQTVAATAELVKSTGEATMSAGEMALLAAEAAGATAAGIITGVALPVIAGGIGVVGLCGMGYYAWKHKGWTFKGIKESFDQARAEASIPGTWPSWEGHTIDAIWADDALLEEATRPEPSEPSADELEIDWDQLALECAA